MHMQHPAALAFASLVACRAPAEAAPQAGPARPSPGDAPVTMVPLAAPQAGPARPSLGDAPVTMVPLAAPLDRRDAELSGLAWHGERLVLLPQYPGFAGEPALYSLARADIEASLAGELRGPLTPTPIEFIDDGVPREIAGFQGYEAIAIAGGRAWLTIEARTLAGMAGHLVAATVAPDLSRVTLDRSSLVELPPQSSVGNLADEALVVAGDRLISLYEGNGAAISARPYARSFDLELGAGKTLPMPTIEYRVTDASELDARGRFWVIDYFYPGDGHLLPACEADCDPRRGELAIERLVELELRADRVVRSETPVIDLQLDPASSRNWEGLARLGERGFLVASDKYPGTLLGFVPRP